jgi:hypothetical protein
LTSTFLSKEEAAGRKSLALLSPLSLRYKAQWA